MRPDSAIAHMHVRGWVLVRWIVVTAYVIVLVRFLVRDGIPVDEYGQFAWMLAGLAVVCIGRPWRSWIEMVISWSVFAAVLLGYDYSRGMAYRFTGPFIAGYPAQGAVNPLGMPLHVTFPVRFDKFLFDGTLPTQWLQAHLHPGHVIPVIAVIVSLTYLSHFLVMPVTAVVLWVRRSPLFRVWLALALTLAVIGLIGYFVYPMTPPWLASQQGYISGPPVLRLTNDGWQYLGIKFATSLIDSGVAFANPVAAMPSLHVAYATLATGFFFFSAKRRWIRIAVWAYPPLMALSLIYGGEHYVTDEIFGALTAGVILAAWRVLHRRRMTGAARAAQRAPAADAVVAGAGG